MDTPTGIWLGASHDLGRPVPVGEPYPHICRTDIVGTMTGQRYTLTWRDCAACQYQALSHGGVLSVVPVASRPSRLAD